MTVYGQRCPTQALDVLHACSQSHSSLDPPATGAAADLSGLPGVWAAVRYLSHLGSEQADLIRQHSGWILSQDPEAGLQVCVCVCVCVSAGVWMWLICTRHVDCVPSLHGLVTKRVHAQAAAICVALTWSMSVTWL